MNNQNIIFELTRKMRIELTKWERMIIGNLREINYIIFELQNTLILKQEIIKTRILTCSSCPLHLILAIPKLSLHEAFVQRTSISNVSFSLILFPIWFGYFFLKKDLGIFGLLLQLFLCNFWFERNQWLFTSSMGAGREICRREAERDGGREAERMDIIQKW